MQKEYFYSVVVKAKTKGVDAFTYKSEESLPLFSIVEIDFNHRKTLGLIIENFKKPNFDPKKIKPIVRIIDTSFLFDGISLELGKISADFYYTSLGKVVFWALPTIARRLANQETIIFPKIGKIKPKLIEPFFLQADIWQRFEFYKKAIKKELDLNRQVLLLAPNLDSWLVQKLAKIFSSVIISPKETRAKNYLAWKKAVENRTRLVIGSQKALFLPLTKLGLILVEDEGNPSFKQEQDPKIEVSHLAKELAKLRGAKLVLAGLTPLPSTYLQIKNKQISFKSVFKAKPARLARGTKCEPRQAKLVDLAKESTLLGFSTELAISKAFKKHHKIILFFNRLGLAKMVLCPDCGFTNHFNNNNENLAICPICSGTKISFHSFGLDRLVYDLKKLYSKREIVDLSKNSLSQKIGDLTVATSFAFKLENKFDLAIMGLAEIGLSLPDPLISYKIFHFGMEALSRGKKKIIQSFSPDHPLIQALSKMDIKDFYNFWLKSRKQLKLYPYFKTIKVVPIKEKDLEKIYPVKSSRSEESQKRLFDRVKKQLKKDVEAIFELEDEKGKYLLASLKYSIKNESKIRTKFLSLSAKITVDPII